MFQRIHYQILIDRVNEATKFIQVLIGPRQIGKTTLITQLLQNCGLPFHFVSADAVPAGNMAKMLLVGNHGCL